MTALNSEKCTACRRDSPPVTNEEKTGLLPQILDWHLVDEQDIPCLLYTSPSPRDRQK